MLRQRRPAYSAGSTRPSWARRDRSPPVNDTTIESASSARVTLRVIGMVGRRITPCDDGNGGDGGNGFTNGGTENGRRKGGVRRGGLRSRPHRMVGDGRDHESPKISAVTRDRGRLPPSAPL